MIVLSFFLWHHIHNREEDYFMNIKQFTFILLSLLSLVSCGESGEYCTEMGCIDGVQINFEPDITTHGAYVFSVTMDGITEICEYSLPFTEESGEYGTCDGENIWLTISGTALDASQHSIPDMYIPLSPTSVSIEITRDDVLITSNTFEPEYEEFAPNGKECGPICYSAGHTINLTE